MKRQLNEFAGITIADEIVEKWKSTWNGKLPIPREIEKYAGLKVLARQRELSEKFTNLINKIQENIRHNKRVYV